MSIKAVESPDMKSTQVAPHESASFDRSALRSSTRLSGVVHPILAGISTTWAGFINRRLEENLTLPGQLHDCQNLSGVLRVYEAYCRTAAAQYQAVFGHLQQIGLTLASELSAATLAPTRICATQHQPTARYSARATRGCFP